MNPSMNTLLKWQNGQPIIALDEGGKVQINTLDIVDAFTDILYDTARYKAGALLTTPFELFSVGIGAQIQLANDPATSYYKQFFDTNLQQQRQLPDAESFLVTHIEAKVRVPNALSTAYSSTSPNVPFPSNLLAGAIASASNQLDAFLSTTQLRLRIGNKDYDQGLLEDFPSNAGIEGFASAATTASTTTIIDGVAQLRGEPRMLAVPHLIRGGRTFGVFLTNGIAFTLLCPIVVGVKLHGIRFRSVQ